MAGKEKKTDTLRLPPDGLEEIMVRDFQDKVSRRWFPPPPHVSASPPPPPASCTHVRIPALRTFPPWCSTPMFFAPCGTPPCHCCFSGLVPISLRMFPISAYPLVVLPQFWGRHCFVYLVQDNDDPRTAGEQRTGKQRWERTCGRYRNLGVVCRILLRPCDTVDGTESARCFLRTRRFGCC